MTLPLFDLLTEGGTRLALALAAGLAGILLVERKRLSSLAKSAMFAKWRTWAIAAPALALAVTFPWGAVAFCSFLSLQGLREYADLTDLPRGERVLLWGAGLAGPSAAALALAGAPLVAPALLLAATLAPIGVARIRGRLRRPASAVLGLAYIPIPVSYLLILRNHLPGRPGILLAVCTAVALSDVCAFVAGKSLGRHRIAPRVSPSKTWEGAVGNVIGAHLGFALMSFALPPLSALTRVVLPVLIGAACLWGDLVESALKRRSGVKDAGSWLPGFGGLLDRIDSLLFAAPLAYAALAMVG
jgi:phosphatidate cytidylyltransferase